MVKLPLKPLGQLLQIARHVPALDGGVQPVGHAAQPLLLFHQHHLVALVGDGERRVHAGHPAADHERPRVDGDDLFPQRLQGAGPGRRHADQLPGLGGRPQRGLGVHPGVLVADVGHFQQVLVAAGGLEGVHENALVGLGGAGGHHHPVEAVFGDRLLHQLLGVLAAGEEVLAGKHHVRQRARVFHHRFHIHDAGDVDAAVADEDADARLLGADVDLGGGLHLPGQGVAAGRQKPAGQAGGGAGFGDRPGDVLRPLEHAAGENPRTGGGHGQKRRRDGEAVFVDVDAETLGELPGFLRHLQADREHHHVEGLRLQAPVVVHVAQLQRPVRPGFVDAVDPGLDEAHAGLVPGP